MLYKKILNTLTLCTLFFVSVYAQEQEKKIYVDFFEQANALYKQNKYEEALTIYKKISNAGAVVYYNMGNCAYKLNNYGYALAYWRRAERNWDLRRGFELLDNIKLLKNKVSALKKESEEKHKNDVILQEVKNFKLTLDFLINSIPLILFQIVFLIAWIMSFIFIRNLFKAKRKAVIVMLFTTIAIFGLILVIKYNFEIKQHGVVVSKNASLLSGPGQNYQVLSFVNEASEVIIEKSVDDFFKVKIDGQTGWISQSSVEKF
jgi:tetratricopeptide (TPR) repeat protein